MLRIAGLAGRAHCLQLCDVSPSFELPSSPCIPPSHRGPSLLQSLAREFLHNAYQVLIGSPDLKANHRITQIFDFPAEHEKYHKLVRILEKVGGWVGWQAYGAAAGCASPA